VSDGRIADNELLYRRIPPGEPWVQPPDQISSANFKLRDGELGLSVYRASVVSAAHVLSKPEAIAGSTVVQVTAGQIRAAQNARGDPLSFDVIPVNDANDPGHAEIRGPDPGVISGGAAKALKNLFKLLEPPPNQS
jgi:hypothetical protein